MFFEKEPVELIEFTNHVLERYVKRTMGKEGNELKQFIVQNEKQIKDKILKLYEYSEPFWYGKIRDHNLTYFTMNRDGWVFVIDKNKTTLVTIYQVDLGLSQEFNKQYVSEIKKYVDNTYTNIEDLKEKYNQISENNNTDISQIKAQNKILQAQIEQNNNRIKFLEDEKNLSQNEISLAEKQLHAKIENFIGAKIF